jgi:hypothetical protein
MFFVSLLISGSPTRTVVVRHSPLAHQLVSRYPLVSDKVRTSDGPTTVEASPADTTSTS